MWNCANRPLAIDWTRAGVAAQSHAVWLRACRDADERGWLARSSDGPDYDQHDPDGRPAQHAHSPNEGERDADSRTETESIGEDGCACLVDAEPHRQHLE